MRGFSGITLRLLRRLALALALVLPWGGSAGAVSLWTASSRSLIADRRASNVGDLVTVVVTQRTVTSHQAAHETEKKLSASGGPGGGVLQFFPQLSVNAERETSGQGLRSEATSLADRVTARVAAITPEGNLLLEARRTVRLGRDELTFTLSGLARPDDINPDNTVLSSQLADCQMKWSGSGPIPEKQRPGLLSALLSLLW